MSRIYPHLILSMESDKQIVKTSLEFLLSRNERAIFRLSLTTLPILLALIDIIIKYLFLLALSTFLFVQVDVGQKPTTDLAE